MNIKKAYDDSEIFHPILEGFKTPPIFIKDRSPLSEYLSISNLGDKKRDDVYLVSQLYDACANNVDCTDPCTMYKDQCVHKNRIKPFRELSKELGNKISGKFTLDPFNFIIYDSNQLYKIILCLKTNRCYFLFNVGEYKLFRVDDIVRHILEIHSYQPSAHLVLCGHSMGGSIALQCAEYIALNNIELFKTCTVIALAPYPSLDTDILNHQPNVFVYVCAMNIHGNLYIDPVYYVNDYKKNHKLPVHLLQLDEHKHITETITSEMKSCIHYTKPLVYGLNLLTLHHLITYLNFFCLLYDKKYLSEFAKKIYSFPKSQRATLIQLYAYETNKTYKEIVEGILKGGRRKTKKICR